MLGVAATGEGGELPRLQGYMQFSPTLHYLYVEY